MVSLDQEPELLSRLFEPFAQADRSLERTRGGLGLGLALVKGLVELHHGEVRAESEGAGRGSRFTVRLPLADRAAPMADTDHRDTGTQAPRAAHERRVLIVEDNRDAAGTLRDLLELSGCAVAVAYSGQDAVIVAPRFRPDLVLCDLNAPIVVDLDKLKSKSRNSPFDGRRLFGEVKMTVVDGRVVYRA